MRLGRCFCVFVVFVVTSAAVGCGGTDSAVVRKPTWATPIERSGCPNLHKVSDELYRGAQPTAEGFVQLKELGIKTVVNLCSFHSDRDELGKTELGYEHIAMKTWHAEDEDVVRFLKIVSNPERTPVFVHCQHGADRTGTIVAVYRMVVCGWSKDEALAEMTQGGFGFHPMWGNLPEYLKELDVQDIRKRAGLMEQQVESRK